MRAPALAASVSTLVLATGFATTGSTLAQSPIQQAMAAQDEAARTLVASDALRVFVCGSASPLGADPKREQACIAVIAGGKIFLIDVGAGSNTNLTLSGLPMGALRAVLLTHFHSDHIAALPDVNLASWVGGRSQPLEVMGPSGVEKVVAGFNDAYALDRGYRVAHHGEAILPPALGVMKATPIEPGLVLEEDGVKITAFAVDHEPAKPAFGYRVDYGGRSVVVSGDTIKTLNLIEASRGADLLFHDAMALGVVKMLQAAREAVGPASLAKILADIQTYHAPTTDAVAAASEAGVRKLVFYHLVPSIGNPMISAQFMQGVPDDVVLAEDGMLFVLQRDSEAIEVSKLFER